MPIDTGIYANLLRPPKSVQEYDQEAQAAQQNALALSTARIGNQNALRDQQESNDYRDAAKGFGADATANYNALLQRGLPTQAAAYQKSALEGLKTKSDIGLSNSHASYFDAETQAKQADAKYNAVQRHAQDVAGVQTPDDLVRYVNQTADIMGVPPEQRQQIVAQSLQKAQQLGLDGWKQAALQASIPVVEKFKTDAENARNLLTNQTSAANNAATNKTHIQTTGMAQAGENSRAALSRQTQMTIAGVAPGGGLDDNGERTAQGIASGQLQPPTGMALLNPKNQRILGRVMEINPQYDSTTVTAKKKAANDFTTGQLGNSMRSFAVAGQHLDQLNTLVDALDNKNLQIVNKIGNAYAQQTGNPAPTNFDAAKEVVSKEVVKAIVAGGGGVSEREELSKLMDKAKSPAQLKGVIQQYRNLMGAQHDALLQQRRAAGLPDSTLPSYTDANGSSSAPNDIHAQADAILRGNK